MEPTTPNRQQIINLINQYIYTNGNQRITAAQLNQILITIANAFVIEGSGGTGGLEQVLQTGNTVTAGREILNSQGGKIELAGEKAFPGFPPVKYVGLSTFREDYMGLSYIGNEGASVGNSKGINPFDPEPKSGTKAAETGNLLAMTSYNVLYENKAVRASAPSAPRGIISQVRDDLSNESYIIQQKDRILSQAAEKSTDVQMEGHHLITQEGVEGAVINGPLSSRHALKFQNATTEISDGESYFIADVQLDKASWGNQESELVRIDSEGLLIVSQRKIALGQSGTNPTAGIATLTGGTVSVSTSAVNADSAISLTVQSTGSYDGNIRVQSTTAGASFTISSTEPEDDCSVFWQIIDLRD